MRKYVRWNQGSVNFKELRRQQGELLRVRPYAVAQSGPLAISSIEGMWRLDDVRDRPRGITLLSEEGDYAIALAVDQLHSYQTPDVLWLRCQILLSSGGFTLEPIPAHIGQTNGRFQIDLPAGESSHLEWTPVHGSGAPADCKILVFTRLVGNPRMFVQPGEVEPNLDGKWVHPAVNLHSPRERYIYALAVDPDRVSDARAVFGQPIASMRQLRTLLAAQGISPRLSDTKQLDRSTTS